MSDGMNYRAASRAMSQYYERWFNNINVLITAAQLAEKGVEEIKSLQDKKSLGQIFFANLLDVGLSVVVPGYFQLSRTWRTFVAKDAQGASNIQYLMGLYSPMKDAASKAGSYKDAATKDDTGTLKIDVLNQMVDHLHKLRAEKRKEKEQVEDKLDLLPDQDIDVSMAQHMFPKPMDFDEVSADIRYAFEWTLLRQFVKHNVTVHHTRQTEDNNLFDYRPDGLSNAACDKIFNRFTKKVTLERDMELVGKRKVLEPVRGLKDLVKVWNAKEEEHTRTWTSMKQ